MSGKTILFVDDERKVLNGLRRMLYPLRNSWDTLIVESGAEALRILAQMPVAILVTDMRMPGMNGLALLEEVRRRHPETVLVMLTGQPDKNLYCEVMAISHYFFWKPTRLEDFEALLARIAELDAVVGGEKLAALIHSIDTLPSLPDIYVQLTALLKQENIGSSQIAAVIEQDMAMAGQLLKLVNSAYFSLSHTIDSMTEAVNYLGLEMVRNLVLAQHLFVQCSPEEHRQFDILPLWRHSLHVAGLAKQLVSPAGENCPLHNLAYLAGLVHDIGKLILIRALPGTYRQVLNECARSGRDQHEVELELLGTDHAALGGYLATLWGFPRVIAEAVALHQRATPLDPASSSPVPEAVWHANRLIHGNFSLSAHYREIALEWQHISR